MPVTLRSHAKINLGLAIGPTRPDGFHALATLYQTIDAHDLVTVSVSDGWDESRVVLSSNDPRVPLDGRNTVAKMLTLALAAPGRERLGARVHIDKRLPIQGGLGGGSGNAAAALLGLEQEIARLRLAPALAGAERLRMGAEVGSDVPLFLLGGTVLGLGRGEEVVPMDDLNGQGAALELVVALPQEGVSTPAAFRAWDEGQLARGLTPDAQTDRLKQLQRALASSWAERHTTGILAVGKDQAGLLSALVQTGILLNDFEEVVFRQHPLLRQIKRALVGELADACAYAALSGSGSAVFGLYLGEEAAQSAERRLQEMGLRSMRTRTVSRVTYWAGMVLE